MNRMFKLAPAALLAGSLSFPVFADQAMLDALTNAGVTMSPTVSAEIAAAQTDAEIAAAVANLLESLGDDGVAIETALAAAVSAAPDSAVAIFDAAVEVIPSSLVSVAVGAVVSAAPGSAAAVVTTAVSLNPTQAESIVSSASTAAPAQTTAIEEAAAAVLEADSPDDGEGNPPSPS